MIWRIPSRSLLSRWCQSMTNVFKNVFWLLRSQWRWLKFLCMLMGGWANGPVCADREQGPQSVWAETSLNHWWYSMILAAMKFVNHYIWASWNTNKKSQICAQRKKSRPCTANGHLSVKDEGKVSSHPERGRHQYSTQNKKRTKKSKYFFRRIGWMPAPDTDNVYVLVKLSPYIGLCACVKKTF